MAGIIHAKDSSFWLTLEAISMLFFWLYLYKILTSINNDAKAGIYN